MRKPFYSSTPCLLCEKKGILLTRNRNWVTFKPHENDFQPVFFLMWVFSFDGFSLTVITVNHKPQSKFIRQNVFSKRLTRLRSLKEAKGDPPWPEPSSPSSPSTTVELFLNVWRSAFWTIPPPWFNGKWWWFRRTCLSLHVHHLTVFYTFALAVCCT